MNLLTFICDLQITPSKNYTVENWKKIATEIYFAGIEKSILSWLALQN